MYKRTQSFWGLVLLAFTLVAGSLQAQTLYACEMMDMVMHDQCCCDDHQDCADANCDDSVSVGHNPCCERTVEVTNNAEAQQVVLPAGQKAENKSDVDPPSLAIMAAEILFSPHIGSPSFVFHIPKHASISGSTTYLITQRLRI